MNQGFHGFPKTLSQPPELIGTLASYQTTDLWIPTSAEPTDLILWCVGTRNGTPIPPTGWKMLQYNDASTSEINAVYQCNPGDYDATGFPYHYTVGVSAGYFAWVCVVFRTSGQYEWTGERSWTSATNQSVGPFTGSLGGLGIGVACDALSGAHSSEFVGMETADAVSSANASCLVAYKHLEPDQDFGPYYSIEAAAYDGYTGLTFNNIEWQMEHDGR